MNRSVPSRLLLVLLAVMLQVALLPGQGRMPCMLRTASLTGCCCVAAAEFVPLTAPTCCDAEPVALPDVLPQMEGRCTCGGDADDLLANPEILPAGGVAEKKVDADDAPHLLLPWHLAEQMRGPSAAPVALRATPRDRTGPPLHVLLQVFLI